MGNDQDDAMFIPITTLQKKITGQSWLRFISVSARSKNETYAAQQQIEGLLRDRHKLRGGKDDDFTVRNLADVAEVADQTGRVMTLLLASIASVSLLVGAWASFTSIVVGARQVRGKAGVVVCVA